MKIKLIHTSDLHIDWLFNRFTSQAKRVRRKELLQGLEMISNLAIDEGVDGVLISGDLFHSNRVDRHTATEVWMCLDKMSRKGIHVFIIPGNHDTEVASILSAVGDTNEQIHFFEREAVINPIDGLTVYGVPYEKDMPERSPLLTIKKNNTPGYHVAMVHGTVKKLDIMEDRYGPITEEGIAQTNLDYIALGHYHNYQDCTSGNVKAYYTGSPVVLSFDTATNRYVNLVTLEPGSVKVQPIAMPSREYITYSYDMTGKSLVDLYRQIDNWINPKACVRIELKGIVNEMEVFPLKDRLIEKFKEKFFYFEIEDNSILFPEERPHDHTIKGIFVNKINQRLNSPELTQEEHDILLAALRAGLTAMEGRRLE